MDTKMIRTIPAKLPMVEIWVNTDPMHSNYVLAEVPSGQTLRQICGDVPIEAYVGGTAVDEEYINTVIIVPTASEIRVSPIPQGGKDLWRNVAQIVVVVAAIAVGALLSAVPGGAYIGLGVLYGGLALVDWLIPAYVGTSKDGFTSLNSLTGASNSIAQFTPIPRLYGKIGFYPPIPMTAPPYTEILGDEQYLRLLLCLGWGPLDIGGVSVGEGFDKAITYGNFAHTTLIGTPITIGGTDIGNYDDVEFQIGRPDQMTLYTDEVVETNPNWNTSHPDPIVGWNEESVSIIRTSDVDATELSIDIWGSLYSVNSDGDNTMAATYWLVEYRLTGTLGVWIVANSPSAVEFPAHESLVIQSTTQKTIRKGMRWAVPKGQYDVRVKRHYTYHTNVDGYANDMTWVALRTIKNTPAFTIPGTVVMAIRIKATDQLSGTLDNIRVVATSILNVWNGTAWVLQATRAPAWAFVDALTGKATRRPLPLARVDATALLDWATQTNLDQDYFDIVIDDSSPVGDRLNSICMAGRASWLLRDDAIMSVIMDIPDPTPKMIISPRNSSGFKYEISSEDIPHAYRVKFVNPISWDSAERVVYDDGYNAGNATLFEELNAIGCTSSDQAWRLGRYFLAQRKLRPELYTFSQAIQYLRYTRGDLLQLQHPVIEVGQVSGRVAKVKTVVDHTELTVDEYLYMETGVSYGMRIQLNDGSVIISPVTTVAPGTNDPILNALYANIDPDCLFVFGVLGEEVIDVKVTRVIPQENFTATIVCVPAALNILDALSGVIPAWDPVMSTPIDLDKIPLPVPAISQIVSDETVAILNADGTLMTRMSIETQTPSFPGWAPMIQARIRLNGTTDGWELSDIVHVPVIYITNVNAGRIYDVQVRSVRGNMYSVWGASVVHTVIGVITHEIAVPNKQLQASSLGVVVDYIGTGTTIQVKLDGVYFGFALALGLGLFTISAVTVSPAGSISIGAITGQGTDTAIIADHSAMSNGVDYLEITYTITLQLSTGAIRSFPIVQTITKVRQGADGLQGIPGIQGLQGIQGIIGDQGIQGLIGPDGLTAYSHIAYADDAVGTGFNQLPAGKAYVGFYADHTLADSSTPGDYTWSLILGADGAQGIQGPIGPDGLTSYFHIAWATSSDGSVGFSTTVSVGKTYIGTYSDHTLADSESYAAYSWTLMKGDTGATGAPAQGMSLVAGRQTLNVTSRGIVYGTDIVITATLQNMTGVPTWSIYSGTGTLLGADALFRTLDISTVTTDSITVQATLNGIVSQIGLSKVFDGKPAPMKLGSLSALPTQTPLGEPLVNGDYFMASTTFTEATVTYLVGEIYVYTNGAWIVTNDGSIVLSMGDEFVSLTETTPDTIASKVIAKRVYAQQAVIDELMTSFLEVKELLYAQYSRAGIPPVNGAGFWLHKSGLFKAKNAELIGTLRTGPNAPTDARVGIQDAIGIISGPTFTGAGLDDLIITQEGLIPGNFQVKINTVNSFSNSGAQGSWIPPFSTSDFGWTTIVINSTGRLVAVGYGGCISYSDDDGITWVTPYSTGNHDWQGLAVNSTGRFVAVGTDVVGSKAVMSYSDDGITWATPFLTDFTYWMGIAVNSAGRFVAVGYNGYISYSDDGITWGTPFIVGVGTNYWFGIAVNSTGRFVAVGSNVDGTQDLVSYSDDGITWVTPFITGSTYWLGVTVNSAGRFVAFGLTGYISYSDDGITWVTPFQVGNIDWECMAVNSTGRFVIMGDTGCISYSDNGGITWATPFIIGTNHWLGVAVNSTGRFVAVGYVGDMMYTPPQDSLLISSDGGTTWGSDTVIPLDGIIPLTGFDIVILFGKYNGHTIGDYWAFIQMAMRGMAILDDNGVEYFSASDGGIYIKDSIGNTYFTALDGRIGIKDSAGVEYFSASAGVVDINKLTLNGKPFWGTITSTVKSSFASPSISPYGLTFDGINLISCDSNTDMIYIHAGVSATILSSFATPGGYPNGLAFDSNTGNLISCDAYPYMIYVHAGVSATLLSSFASPSTSASGLTFDPNTGNLISCDTNTDMIYIHAGVSGTILSSFASPGTSPYGLAFDSNTGNLISCDYNTNMIYVHAGVSATILSSFASPSTSPTGLAFTGINLISCDSGTDMIYIQLSLLGI